MTHKHRHKPVAVTKPLTIEDTLPSLASFFETLRQVEMFRRFRLWLDAEGYSPLSQSLRNPPGVSIGYDGLTVPTLSDDCPCFLLGAALTRLGMYVGNRVINDC